MSKKRILGVIGLGHVGAHVAYALAVQGIADELILVDQNEKKLSSEVQDLRDAAAYLPHRVTVRAGGFQEQEWVDRYQQTSGLAADGYAIYFYEAAAVALESLSNAIDAAGGKPTRAQVVEAMANVEITSITGTFQFDEKGDNRNAKAYAYEIVDGYPGKMVGELTGA